MPSVTTGKIAVALQTSLRDLVKIMAGSSTFVTKASSATVSGERPALLQRTSAVGGSTFLTLSGKLDDEIEVLTDALNVADA